MDRIAAAFAIMAGILIIASIAMDIMETSRELPKPMEIANRYTSLAAIISLLAALVAAIMA